MILIEGLNRIRDLIVADLTQGQAGTGTSTATAEDTGLDEAQGSTLKTLSTNVSDRLITTSFTLNSAEGNGLVLTEMENRLSSGDSLARIRFTPITKDNTKELTFVLTFELTSR